MGQRQGESGRTLGIEYGGEALRSGSRRVWKVRVWDGTGEPSAYGGPAVYETGLLREIRLGGRSGSLCIAARKGTWRLPTGDAYDEIGNGLAPSPYLRKVFGSKGAVRRARLYATARGVYAIHLNGAKVGDVVLAPGWTDYRKRVQYQTYDVTELLAARAKTSSVPSWATAGTPVSSGSIPSAGAPSTALVRSFWPSSTSSTRMARAKAS